VKERKVWKAEKVNKRKVWKAKKEREREKEKREKKKKNLCFKGEHEPREETVFGAVHCQVSAVSSLENVSVREAWSCRCTGAGGVEWAVGVS